MPLNKKEYHKEYVFASVSVADVRGELSECKGNYPELEALTDDQLFSLLHHCWSKGRNIFQVDSWNVDLSELQDISNYYFEEQTS